MRLICPNCDAQYEVGDGVIPLVGRDVQCSNCGQTWYQKHPNAAPDDEDEDIDGFDIPAQDPPASEPELPAPTVAAAPEQTQIPAVEPPPAPRDIPVPIHDPVEDPISFTDPGEDQIEPAAARAPSEADQRRRTLDEAVMNVLREEAEREALARRGVLPPPAVPPDPAEQAEPAPATPLRRPLSRELVKPHRKVAEPRVWEDLSDPAAAEPATPESPPASAPVEAPARTARRDLLPNIEEINSSLVDASERPRPTADDFNLELPKPKSRGGFRRAFILILGIGLLAMLVYALAPLIVENLPQAEPYLTIYVAWVDTGRVWLDGQMQRLLDFLQPPAAPQ